MMLINIFIVLSWWTVAVLLNFTGSNITDLICNLTPENK